MDVRPVYVLPLEENPTFYRVLLPVYAKPNSAVHQRASMQASADEPAASKRRKKKIGRPVAYLGDPDSEELSPAQRRKVKRRIANRESARRTLLRHKDSVDALTDQIEELTVENSSLGSKIREQRQQVTQLTGQKARMYSQLREAVCEWQHLQQEMAALQEANEVHTMALYQQQQQQHCCHVEDCTFGHFSQGGNPSPSGSSDLQNCYSGLPAFEDAASLPSAPQCAFPAIGFAGTLEYSSKGPCTAPPSLSQWPSNSLMDNCLPLYGQGPRLFEP